MHASGLVFNRVISPTIIQYQRQHTGQCRKGSQARYLRRAGHSRLLESAVVQAGPVAMQELHIKQESACNNSSVKHLIVMANGLYGNSSNWDVVIEHLRKVLDTSETLLAASDANSLKQTFDGIDSCGKRLANEIKAKVKKYPSLQKISFIGHSMGGLLVRYAAGKLYDPSTKLICGLRPAHFITMATPHMGCDGQGPAQVPFIGWTGDVPLAGSSLQKLLQSAARPFVSAFMKQTGRQCFMYDTEEGQVPLLVRMSEDISGEGFFISALASFVTRTCYGNAGGDHLVGWANSSIRHPDELPEISAEAQRQGVIREEPVQAAMHPQAAAFYMQHHASYEARRDTNAVSTSRQGTGQDAGQVADASNDVAEQLDISHDRASLESSAAQSEAQSPASTSQAVQSNHEQGQQQEAAEQTLESSQNALLILERLQILPWRRIDVSFEGTNMPFFAHNHIQVTRKWLNWYGNAVCQHLAEQLADMEKNATIQGLIEGCIQTLKCHNCLK